MDTILNISAQQLRRAADLQERIQSLQRELAQLLGSNGSAAAAARAPKTRRLSAAGRARIAAAARARWAKQRGQKRASAMARPAKRKLSAAARARLSAIAKARWQKAKASGKSAL